MVRPLSFFLLSMLCPFGVRSFYAFIVSAVVRLGGLSVFRLRCRLLPVLGFRSAFPVLPLILFCFPSVALWLYISPVFGFPAFIGKI
jgi:hypothetical protein